MPNPTPPAGALSLSMPAQSLGAASASTYSDTNGLAALKANPDSPEALHAAAQQVDALFLQMMLKSMRDATAEINGTGSNELGMYQDLFDKQIALTMSQQHGLGLGTALLKRLPGMSAGARAATAPTGGVVAPTPTPTPPPAVPAAPGSTASAADFVSEVLPTIRDAAQALGVNPLGLLAQAALETGWGQRMPRGADGAPSLNLFGIKADETWAGARVTASTLEFKAGVATPQRTAFRAYASIADSVRDFASLLQNSPRYRQALVAGGSSAEGYAAAIGRSGYATDPQYGNKLTEILGSSTLRAALQAVGREL